MNKQTKIKIFVFFLIFAVSFSAIAVDLKDLQERVANFSEKLAETLPLNSSLGLNWADAYIGKAFPGAPLHFGVGGTFGVTTMDTLSIMKLAGNLGYKLPYNLSKMPFPAYTAEIRMGGIFLPFDMGFKFGYLNQFEFIKVKTDYLLVGGDIRYAILDKPILPKISVGAGFNYIQGAINAKVGSEQKFTYGGPESITIKQPDLEIHWKSYSLDFKAQISKSFLIVTPYLGLGASYAWSEAGYSVKAKVETSADQLEIDKINEYLEGESMDTIKGDENGISSVIKNSNFNLRAFGGVSFNMAVFKIDLTGLYSFLDNNFGGSLGFRFQL
jgi:hypothetical protein